MYFVPEATEEEIRREKAKARALRASPWWKRKKQSGVCRFCGGKFPPQTLTMEHIVPLIRGGKTEKSNIAPACKDCNNKKKYLLPSEWQEYMEKIGSDENYL